MATVAEILAAGAQSAGAGSLAGYWLEGSPEWEQYMQETDAFLRERASVNETGVAGVTNPLAIANNWRSGNNVFTGTGAQRLAFNPNTGHLIGLDASGNPITGSEFSVSGGDRALMNMSLLAAGVIGGAVAGAGVGGSSAAGSEFAAGAAATDAGAASWGGLAEAGAAGGGTAGAAGGFEAGAGATDAGAGAWGGGGAAGTPEAVGAAGGANSVGGTGSSAGTGAGSNLGGTAGGTGNYWDQVLQFLGQGNFRDYTNLLSGLYGMYTARQVRDEMDPFREQRGYYGARLRELEENPGLIRERPGYRAGIDSINREMASRGYLGGGNQAVGLMRFAGDFTNQELNRLATLAGAGTAPGAGMPGYTNLMNSSLASIGYGLAPFSGNNRPRTGGSYYGGGYTNPTEDPAGTNRP